MTTTTDTQHAPLALGSGGALLLAPAEDSDAVELTATMPEGRRAAVRIEWEGVRELLGLVHRVLEAALAGDDLSAEHDAIDLDEDSLESGDELYAAYCTGAGDADEDEDEPEGLHLEAMQDTDTHADVHLALAELPALQMRLTALLLSGLGR